MNFIVHGGTGTVVNADECVIVNVPDAVLEAMSGDDYFDDAQVLSMALVAGRNLQVNDLTYGNTMAFSPEALREEARALLDAGFASDESRRDAFSWCANIATDDQLNQVASYILDDDDLWRTFRTSVIDGLLQGLAWHKEPETKETV